MRQMKGLDLVNQSLALVHALPGICTDSMCCSNSQAGYHSLQHPLVGNIKQQRLLRKAVMEFVQDISARKRELKKKPNI